MPVVKCGKVNRAFNIDRYNKYLWLTGSQEMGRLVCWSCLLFPSKGNEIWQKSGFSDFKNLSRSLVRHSISQEHIQAEISLNLLGTVRIEHEVSSVTIVLNHQHNERVRKNREILKPLINIATVLGRQGLVFRGHEESDLSDNKGNFKEIYSEFYAKDSELLKSLESSSGFVGTSKTIQNDLIESIVHVIKSKIVDELQKSSFFSWQIDETTDVATKSQLSIVLRYITEGEVVERFFVFFDVSAGRDAESLKNLIFEAMEPYDFKNKLVAQTYDGAAVMSSELKGLQSKVKEVATQANFVHCYAHKLNLALSHGSNEINKSRIFFSDLGGFSTFFSKSTKRTNTLNSYNVSHLPTNAPTRWNF